MIWSGDISQKTLLKIFRPSEVLWLLLYCMRYRGLTHINHSAKKKGEILIASILRNTTSKTLNFPCVGYLHCFKSKKQPTNLTDWMCYFWRN